MEATHSPQGVSSASQCRKTAILRHDRRDEHVRGTGRGDNHAVRDVARPDEYVCIVHAGRDGTGWPREWSLIVRSFVVEAEMSDPMGKSGLPRSLSCWLAAAACGRRFNVKIGGRN